MGEEKETDERRREVGGVAPDETRHQTTPNDNNKNHYAVWPSRGGGEEEVEVTASQTRIEKSKRCVHSLYLVGR